MSDGIQQLFFLTREDVLSLFDSIERKHRLRYYQDTYSEDGQFRAYSTAREMDGLVKLGVSQFGHSSPRLWLQFEPHIEIPVKKIDPNLKGKAPFYSMEFPKGGAIEFSTGGLFEKTGEIVSGRIAFTLWFQSEGQKFNFRDRAWGYEDVLTTAKELGAKIHKAYLIGQSAWRQYKADVPLVFQTGLNEGARFRE